MTNELGYRSEARSSSPVGVIEERSLEGKEVNYCGAVCEKHFRTAEQRRHEKEVGKGHVQRCRMSQKSSPPIGYVEKDLSCRLASTMTEDFSDSDFDDPCLQMNVFDSLCSWTLAQRQFLDRSICSFRVTLTKRLIGSKS